MGDPYRRGGNFGIGEIWNGEIWHNKIVPNFAMVFKNSCQILPAPNFAMLGQNFPRESFLRNLGNFLLLCVVSVLLWSWPQSRNFVPDSPWYLRIRAKFCPHQIWSFQISPNPKFPPSGRRLK